MTTNWCVPGLRLNGDLCRLSRSIRSFQSRFVALVGLQKANSLSEIFVPHLNILYSKGISVHRIEKQHLKNPTTDGNLCIWIYFFLLSRTLNNPRTLLWKVSIGTAALSENSLVCPFWSAVIIRTEVPLTTIRLWCMEAGGCLKTWADKTKSAWLDTTKRDRTWIFCNVTILLTFTALSTAAYSIIFFHLLACHVKN